PHGAEEHAAVGQGLPTGAAAPAEFLKAAPILFPTFSGGTASGFPRLPPRRSVLGLTHHEYAWRQMAIEWGVIPLHIPECADVEELWERSIAAARDAGDGGAGDRVGVAAGDAGRSRARRRSAT